MKDSSRAESRIKICCHGGIGKDIPRIWDAATAAYGRTASVIVAFTPPACGHIADLGNGRSICKVMFNGLDVNREQIAQGMTWMYRRYSSDPQYSQAEAYANANRIGLWRDTVPQPP